MKKVKINTQIHVVWTIKSLTRTVMTYLYTSTYIIYTLYIYYIQPKKGGLTLLLLPKSCFTLSVMVDGRWKMWSFLTLCVKERVKQQKVLLLLHRDEEEGTRKWYYIKSFVSLSIGNIHCILAIDFWDLCPHYYIGCQCIRFFLFLFLILFLL